MYCRKCGAELEDGARFCTECGAQVDDANPQQRPSAADSRPQQQPSAADSQSQGQQPAESEAKKGMSKTAVIVIGAVVVVAVIVGAAFASGAIGGSQEEREETPAASAPAEGADSDGADSGDAAESETAAEPDTSKAIDGVSWLRTDFPEDIAAKVAVTYEAGNVVVSTVDEGKMIAVIAPGGFQNHYMADTMCAIYQLGQADAGSSAENVFMGLPYYNTKGNMLHAMSSEKPELGLEKYLGISADKIASCFLLSNSGEFVHGTATLENEGIPEKSQQNESAAKSNSSSSAHHHEPSDHYLDHSYASSTPFWGVWTDASKSESAAYDYLCDWRNREYDAVYVRSDQWSNLNSEPYYCVSTGAYATESEAKAALKQVKKRYPDAYVKYTGEHR